MGAFLIKNFCKSILLMNLVRFLSNDQNLCVYKRRWKL